MATPTDKLADSLEALHALQGRGIVAIRSADLSRTHRQRLLQHGFLQEVIKGWYVPARPDETRGESTAWYASYWHFCATYLEQLKGEAWCLYPEQSIALHVGNWTVPQQLLIRAKKARNNITRLPHGTTLLDAQASLPSPANATQINGVRVYTLPAALVACPADSFKQNAIDLRAALSAIKDASEVLEPLLEGGHSVIAGRLAAAFRNVGRAQIADEIIATMRAAGYDIREKDPFAYEPPQILSPKEQSPYVNRIRLMWHTMREPVIEHFPDAPGMPKQIKRYLKQVEASYINDAYHSLSIEGYRVSPELIQKVRTGNWHPERNSDDQENLNALAARGYWQASQAVQTSIESILKGKNPGTILDNDHRLWYREMFTPGVSAGIYKASDLAGYRNGPVFIRRSMHVPPNREAVRDTMPALFELLSEEEHPAVRTVLGHFIFVYIHPYMDGNGRLGRFLMNAMLASGGYPWTIIPVEQRNDYMAALETASTRQDILPFATFIGKQVSEQMNHDAE